LRDGLTNQQYLVFWGVTNDHLDQIDCQGAASVGKGARLKHHTNIKCHSMLRNMLAYVSSFVGPTIALSALLHLACTPTPAASLLELPDNLRPLLEIYCIEDDVALG
jgi:hypothetical protein